MEFDTYVDKLLRDCAALGDEKAIELLSVRTSSGSSEMQPHEEKPERKGQSLEEAMSITKSLNSFHQRLYRVEGSGPSVKDPPPQGETDDRLK